MNVTLGPWAAGKLAGLAGLGAVLLAVTAAGPASAQAPAPDTITTVAGGLGGPGPSRTVGVSPCAVTYAGGSLYATDLVPAPLVSGSSLVRKISMATGTLTTVAGNGTNPAEQLDQTRMALQPSAGTKATAAGIGPSCGVAVDGNGNLLISDTTYHRNGGPQSVSLGLGVVAGSAGTFYGQQMVKGGFYPLFRGSSPVFDHSRIAPGMIAVDQAGNVLFTADTDRVYALAQRSGTFYGQHLSKGQLYVIAGGGASLSSGVPATSASLDVSGQESDGLLDAGLRVDRHGNVVIADQGHCLVRVVAGRSGRFYGRAMLAGRIYTIAGNRRCWIPGDPLPRSGAAATNAELSLPAGIAVDHAGNIVVANDPWIEVIATSAGRFYGLSMRPGHAYRIAGNGTQVVRNGGPALKSGLLDPAGVSVDGAGNVVIAESDGLRFIPERSGPFYGRHGLRTGDIYPITGPEYSGDGGPATLAEYNITNLSPWTVSTPLAVDRPGDLFIINDNEVRMIPARTGRLFGRQLRAGYSYRIAGQPNDAFGSQLRDGELATAATLSQPTGVAVDGSGNLLIADTADSLVRVVAAASGAFYGQQMIAGHVYNVAGGGAGSDNGGLAVGAGLDDPGAVATDQNGTLLIGASCQVLAVPVTSGSYYGQAMTAGHIYLIAGTHNCTPAGIGGPASAAGLAFAYGLKVDSAGNILVNTGWGVMAIAASSGTFYGQPMTAGNLYAVTSPPQGFPVSFTLDQRGNIVETNFMTDKVNVIAESDGTYYGQPMTTGDTYRIAGNGVIGRSGIGGPAARAELDEVNGVVSMPDGDLVISQAHWLSRITG